MLNFIFNCVISVMNFIISAIATVINLIFSLLPDSPFLNLESKFGVVSDYLPYLSWLLPIKSMSVTLLAFLVCVASYYIYASVLRWIKMIN